MKIRLDKKAVSWNKIYSGKHWSWRKKLRDEWGEFIYFSLLKNKVKRVAYTHRIDIKIIAYQKRTLDPDNICSKLIIDGLKDYGIIEDDSSKYIRYVTTGSKKSSEEYILLEIKPSTG